MVCYLNRGPFTNLRVHRVNVYLFGTFCRVNLLAKRVQLSFKIEQNLGTIVLKVLYGDYSLKDKISLFCGTVEVYGL